MGKIIVVDDDSEEREKARCVVEKAGHEALVFECISDRGFVEAVESADGVLTDFLMPTFNGNSNHLFRENGMAGRKAEDYIDKPIPGGLVAALISQAAGKPFVFCTSCSMGKHHQSEYSWLFEAFIRPIANKELLVNLRMGWNEKKDWKEALEQLMNIIATSKRDIRQT